MNLQEFLGQVLFEWGNLSITLAQLLQLILSLGAILVLAALLLRRWMPRFYDRDDTSTALRGRARLIVSGLVILITFILVIKIFQLDPKLVDEYPLSSTATINIWVSTLLKAFLAFWLASFLDWLLEEYLTQRLYRQEAAKREVSEKQRRFKSLRPVFYCIAALYVANITGFSSHVLFEVGEANDPTSITIRSVLTGMLVIFMIRVAVKLLIGFAFNSYYRNSQLDQGSQYAINRLFTYFAYLIGFLLTLEVAGLDLVGLWAGAAALLVGVGIGLQQTFNDLICGVIILFERSVKVGDVLDISGSVGTVRKIGTRTSTLETRDSIVVYVPNSKLIGENVVNWSQTERKARFILKVGVAYGSNTQLVKELLTKAAAEHKAIMKFPAPIIRFTDFGSSSLDFEILFFSKEFIRIEDVKSDLRFAIDTSFRDQGVEIPFPQRDLWLRNPEKISGLEETDSSQATPSITD
ncbi:MAG: mechanosensitive ion channel domain-containing protein [Bacteroidota bacterium]